jgi:hypothetical protein
VRLEVEIKLLDFCRGFTHLHWSQPSEQIHD